MAEPLISPLSYRELFVLPVLEYLGDPFDSEDRVSLIVNIANHESDGFRYVRQVGGGPGLGYTQIEHTTHDDTWVNWLAFRRDLAIKAWKLIGEPPFGKIPSSTILVTNPGYAVAMTAFIQRRAPGELPHYLDIEGQARYWKKWYNTPLGKGREADFIERAERALKDGLY